jgi:hypothetical protein
MEAFATLIVGASGLAVFFIGKYMERKSINKAVFAEIQRLLKVVRKHCDRYGEWMANGETQHHPLIPFSCDVYAKHVGNIGLMDGRYVGLVVKFYGYLNFVNSFQTTQVKEWELHDNKPESFDQMYVDCLRRLINDFGDAFSSANKKYKLS